MTTKRWLISAAAVVGILFVTDFVVHAVLMKGAYESTASLWRPKAEMMKYCWAIWVIYLVNGLVLPRLYARGHEAAKVSLGQGLRFGSMIGLLIATGMSFGNWMMIPMPGSMAAIWFITCLSQYILCGIVIAQLHRS